MSKGKAPGFVVPGAQEASGGDSFATSLNDTPDNPELRRALSLARVGWPVFPTRNKVPLVDAWPTAATTDPDLIKVWWTVDFPDAEPAIATGRAGLAVVDVDAGTKRGAENLAEAKIVLPDTFSYRTPSGGSHHLYRAPEGEWTIAQNEPVSGVDLRAGVGYIRYVGPVLTERPKLAKAPTWALIPRTSSSTDAPRATAEAVIKVLRSYVKGKPSAEVKALRDSVHEHGMHRGDAIRITKEFADLGSAGHPGVRKAYLQARETYIRHYPEAAKDWDLLFAGVDAVKEGRLPPTIIQKRAEPVETPPSLYVDVRQVLAGDMRPVEPDAGGIRPDGRRLLYRGKVNGLVGESGVGKTIAAACMAADEIRLGGSVLWADLDHNGAQGTIGRLVAAGIDADTLADPSRFRLTIPETKEELAEVVTDAAGWSPTMAVVDSVGEVVPMFGGASNDADDYTTVHREVFARLAKCGAAVLVLDHLAKTALGTGYASGTGAKKRAMDGAYFAVKAVEPFKPGVGGAAALAILKDRFGGVAAMTETDTAAVFRLDSRHDTWTWEFYPAKSSDERASDQLEADVAFILALDEFPTSKEAVIAAVKAKADDGRGWGKDRAFAALTLARSRRDELTTLPRSVPRTVLGVPGTDPLISPGVPTPLGGDPGTEGTAK